MGSAIDISPYINQNNHSDEIAKLNQYIDLKKFKDDELQEVYNIAMSRQQSINTQIANAINDGTITKEQLQTAKQYLKDYETLIIKGAKKRDIDSDDDRYAAYMMKLMRDINDMSTNYATFQENQNAISAEIQRKLQEEKDRLTKALDDNTLKQVKQKSAAEKQKLYQILNTYNAAIQQYNKQYNVLLSVCQQDFSNFSYFYFPEGTLKSAFNLYQLAYIQPDNSISIFNGDIEFAYYGARYLIQKKINVNNDPDSSMLRQIFLSQVIISNSVKDGQSYNLTIGNKQYQGFLNDILNQLIKDGSCDIMFNVWLSAMLKTVSKQYNERSFYSKEQSFEDSALYYSSLSTTQKSFDDLTLIQKAFGDSQVFVCIQKQKVVISGGAIVNDLHISQECVFETSQQTKAAMK